MLSLKGFASFLSRDLTKKKFQPSTVWTIPSGFRTLGRLFDPALQLSRNEKVHHFERKDRNIKNFEIYHFVCRFPINDSKLLEAWIEKLNKNDWQPTGTSILSSEHCEESYFRISKGKHMPLKTNSVPTIFVTENVGRKRLQNEGKPPIWLQSCQYSEDFFDVRAFSIAKTFFLIVKHFFQ